MSNDIMTSGVFDCDTHIYEPRDAATRYLAEEFMDRSIRTIRNTKDQDVVLAGSRVANFLSEEGMGFEQAYRPGSLREMLAAMASGDPDAKYLPEPMRPEFLDRDLRMKLLDEQGVAKAVVFPGALALAAENYVSGDVEALYANIRSYNRWYNEAWGFNHQDRIYATALMSLRDLDKAVENVEDIIEKGAKVVLLPTGPAYGRSPGDPYFDPIWSRLDEAGVVLALHIMPNWYFEAISPAWGQNTDPASWHMSAWQWMNVYGERPIVDTLSALIFDNLFGRFPNLNVLVAEHGASWVPHTLKQLDKSRGMGRNGPWIGGQLTERPSAVFKRHVRVAPYPEDDIPGLIDALDGDDSVYVFGSDYPHAEGVETPSQYEAKIMSLPEDQRRRIMRGNAEAIFS
jgi:predicted TIM-barrel fold metal-dependent hydrolase